MYNIPAPYLHFLGDAPDRLAAKTAIGVHYWRPELSVGQYRMPSCQADLEIDDLSIGQAVERGAKTLVIGVANRGGVISRGWEGVIIEAIEAGMNVASGLHGRLNENERFREVAEQHGCQLIDVRYPLGPFPVATGAPRNGKRVLTVGTDCSCGKMYTSLALEAEFKVMGVDADFRATGQTGILIAGDGAPVDAIGGDFISGVSEILSPDNSDSHWDLIEGQGSLFHPSYAGVSLGLLHGSQPDWIIMCHEPTRTHMRGLPHFGIPEIGTCIEANLAAGRLTNPGVRLGGISLNSSALSQEEAAKLSKELAQRFGVPVCDPVRGGVRAIIDFIS